MLLTRPMNHHHFQQHQQQLTNDSTTAAVNDHATPNSSNSALYYNIHNSTTPLFTVDNFDLDLSGYAASIDADSPPPLMRSTDDGMHDAWLSQHTKPAGRFSTHQVSHNRNSSLGSLSASGSASGPASPASPAFTFTSNPQIAVTEDGQSIPSHGAGGDYYQLAKSYAPAHDAFYPNYPAYQADPTAAAAYTNMLASTNFTKPKSSERGLLPPPELSTSSRSRPVSVASSIASADSPATPAPGEPEERRSRNVGLSSVVPKFERTMTDVFNDELFHPNFAIEASSPQAQSPQQAASPSNELFAQRLHAANSQHMSPIGMSRDRSPFRNGSPLAPSPLHDFGTTAQQHNSQPRHQSQQQQAPMGFNSAQQMRERRKAEQDAEVIRQQLQGSAHARATPQTISPKDVALEFPETDNDVNNFPLFPQGPSAGTGGFTATEEQINKAVAAVGSGLPLDFYSQIPQQYPFVAVGQVPMPHDTGAATPLRADLARAVSLAPSQSSSGGHHSHSHSQSHSISPSVNSPRRPASTRADGGTYSCTYHGCAQRFETPALLQKHKREGHRQGLGANGRRVDGESVLVGQSDPGMTSSLLNTQQGPHRCDRINPSTNKPCATIFSRPYDLTRHEDTIHNGRKQKVRCQICVGEEKTFSRADALTRHYRVVHPDLEVPGKHRRRAMTGSQH